MPWKAMPFIGFGSRTKYLEECQPALAATLAGAMAVEEAPQAWETGFMTAEQKIVTGNLIRLIRLRTTVKQDAIRTVQRLHRNLGHPGPTELAELLATRGASEEVIEATRNYVSLCLCEIQEAWRCRTGSHATDCHLQPDPPS